MTEQHSKEPLDQVRDAIRFKHYSYSHRGSLHKRSRGSEASVITVRNPPNSRQELYKSPVGPVSQSLAPGRSFSLDSVLQSAPKSINFPAELSHGLLPPRFHRARKVYWPEPGFLATARNAARRLAFEKPWTLPHAH
jgi:hypothetical protein